MTTRNFRVKNGLSVGDIVISASANTITGLSTSAPSADGDVANKKYVDDQAAASLTFTNKTFDANGTGNSISNIEVADFASGVVDTDLDTVSGADDTLASAKAIKAYVDDGLSSLSSTTITEGDSSVVVADSGTGTITLTADAGAVATFAAANTTITASNNINLTATGDVVIPANVGVTFGSGEKIEGDNTDLTITSGAKINLTAGTDVQIPNNVGVLFGVGGEKIESDGTNLTITSTGALDLTATGTTTVTNNFDVGGNMVVSGNLTVNGTETIVSTQNLLIEDAIIGLNSNVSDPANMPRFSGLHLHRGNTSVATETDLYMVWDDATNATGSTTNLGGVFTFLGSVHESGSETPNSGSFILADIKASTVEANLTGDVTGNLTGTASAVADNSVALGTKTTGNYVATGAVSGNGLSGSASAEGATFTVTSNATSANTVSTIVFRDGSGNFSAGTITANLTGTATAAQYSDVAERFASDSMYEPGTVVALGGAAEITAVAEEASDEVFGVISGEHQAAFKMNGAAGSDATHPYVAMTGRVDVKVIGAVNKGDRLISASVPGYARAATKAECTAFNVIGRALSSKQSQGAGSVLAAVRVSH